METFKKQIFEQLGNLFFAIGREQQISSLASGELKMLLRKDWLTEQGDQFEDKVPEPAHLIGLAIDGRQIRDDSASEAFSAFEKFYLTHKEQFTFALKQKILETADAIIAQFPIPDNENLYVKSLTDLLRPSMQGTTS